MKLFERLFKHITLAFLLCFLTPTTASSPNNEPTLQADSIEISLLTCGPRQQVYSLYGHTAIRFQDKQTGRDIAINYGVFSFDKPFFVLRFVFGLTDYEMGIAPFDIFEWEYGPTGCGVRQQVLNLTAQEKMAIAQAVDRNMEPQNRVYRYNFFYDNCTTRARDIIADNLNGRIVYDTSTPQHLNISTPQHHNTPAQYPTFRNLIHNYNETHRWARFGNDLLLGVKADYYTTFEQQQFLPERLCADFERAHIISADGTKRNLVSSSFWLFEPTTKQQSIQQTNMSILDVFSPLVTFSILSILTLIIAIVEYRRKRIIWVFDASIMLTTGACGLLLFAMIFSQHPTVSLNLQILLLNPINIFMLYSVTKAARQNRIHWWTKAWSALILLLLAGSFLQSYAEGITIVALSLLLRNILNIYTFKNTGSKQPKA